MNSAISNITKGSIALLALLVFTCMPASGADTDPHAELISGTILAPVGAAGCTYVNVAAADGPIWVAIPATTVQKGEKISLIPGMEMKDFHSNSLDRTFPTIFFSPGPVAGTAPSQSQPAPAPAPDSDPFAAALAAERQSATSQPQPIQPAQGSGGSLGAIVPFQEMDMERATGENGFTVAELFDKAQELDGKSVRVRGQVVKFNANIMGKNWLHIQDGTGDPMNNTHDLVVTTTDDLGGPKVITIEGILALDRDFGAGYKYSIIVENGVIIE